jgi:hypothetical protein
MMMRHQPKGVAMLRLSLCCSVLVALVTAASAQTIVINPNKTGVMPSPAAEQVRISLAINMFVPALASDSAQALAAQENGRKMVYQAAAQECEVLRATIANSCTLESININVQYVAANQNFAQKAEGYNINGSINYRIISK